MLVSATGARAEREREKEGQGWRWERRGGREEEREGEKIRGKRHNRAAFAEGFGKDAIQTPTGMPPALGESQSQEETAFLWDDPFPRNSSGVQEPGDYQRKRQWVLPEEVTTGPRRKGHEKQTYGRPADLSRTQRQVIDARALITTHMEGSALLQKKHEAIVTKSPGKKRKKEKGKENITEIMSKWKAKNPSGSSRSSFHKQQCRKGHYKHPHGMHWGLPDGGTVLQEGDTVLYSHEGMLRRPQCCLPGGTRPCAEAPAAP
jgi:hypothetical protein